MTRDRAPAFGTPVCYHALSYFQRGFQSLELVFTSQIMKFTLRTSVPTMLWWWAPLRLRHRTSIDNIRVVHLHSSSDESQKAESRVDACCSSFQHFEAYPIPAQGCWFEFSVSVYHKYLFKNCSSWCAQHFCSLYLRKIVSASTSLMH